MNILHLTNTFKADGTGITNVIADLAASQAKAGHSVIVACAEIDKSMMTLARKHGIQIMDGITSHKLQAVLRAARTLRASTQVSDLDIVHVHTVRATLIALLAFPALFLKRSVSTIHNGYQRSVLAMCITRTVVCVSEGDARTIRRKSIWRRPAIVRNGNLGTVRLIDIKKVVQKSLAKESIVYVGALVERKGLDVLLASMALIVKKRPDAKLYVIGNRDNPSMEKLAMDFSISRNVEFVGFSADPRAYMLGASVFVLPSRAEPFGLVLTEARECGVPIVASNVGGIPEVLSSGEAGLLVPPGDIGALTTAIERVLGDPELAADLRIRSKVGLDVFAVENMAYGYDAVYRSFSTSPAGSAQAETS